MTVADLNYIKTTIIILKLLCMNVMSVFLWQEGGDVVIDRANCRAKGGAPGFKVAVLGAAGGIGQSLSLLLKMNPLVSVLHLYDVVNTPGVTADVSHMDTGAVVIFLFHHFSNFFLFNKMLISSKIV